MAAPAEAATAVPRIRRLDEAVVNRIAAGEVLHRPANAVKEMLENSLDAGATSVTVTAKDGGMKLLQIQDNGHGIAREDLPLVCERFATSKLSTFEDLSQIATYGFRGEALASISHVAHVTITSKTPSAECAYRADYKDGKLIAPKPGAPAEPRPTAGVTGTQITVEDLFYNVATRRSALQNSSEEHARIVEVVQRYAIEHAGVSFTCKKHGSTAPDLATQASAARLDNLRTIFGAAVARELLPLQYNSASNQFRVHGYVSNANYSMKKFTFLLFINRRLVESAALKRAIENVYSAYLPKNTHPFVYLSLAIEPSNVDVNVHPTKREVHFLREDAIIEEVCTAIQAKLLNANASRTFMTQTLLPGAAPILEGRPVASALTGPGAAFTSEGSVDPRRLVRTDNRTRTLDAYLSSTGCGAPTPTAADAPGDAPAKRPRPAAADSAAPPAALPPHVEALQRAAMDAAHPGLHALFREHFFVGCVSDTLALVQHQTRLCLVNLRAVGEAFFYQALLGSLGRTGRIRLAEPAPIQAVVRTALDQPDAGWTPADGDRDELAETVRALLLAHAATLHDTYGLDLTMDGSVAALPLILPGYVPNLEHLPLLLLRLGTEVPWSDGTPAACTRAVCSELAHFYAAPRPTSDDPAAAAAAARTEGDGEAAAATARARWAVEHILFPALRTGFYPPKQLAERGDVVQVADLPELYRIFERC